MKQDLFRDRHPLLRALEHRPVRLAGACVGLLAALWILFMVWAIRLKLERLG